MKFSEVTSLLALLLVTYVPLSLSDMVASPDQFSYQQVDETEVNVTLHGGPLLWWEENMDGYTVSCQDYVEYCVLNGIGLLESTHMRVDQATADYLVNIEPHLRPDIVAYAENIGGLFVKKHVLDGWMEEDDFDGGDNNFAGNGGYDEVNDGVGDNPYGDSYNDGDTDGIRRLNIRREVADQRRRRRMRVARQLPATTGVLKNLVINIRFSDHLERALPSVADLDILFNAEGGHTEIAPTGSVKDVFTVNSYGKLLLESTVSDWVTVSKSEDYYADGLHGTTEKLSEALKEALILVQDNGVNFADFDADEDGRIDAITFLHSGYGAEAVDGLDCNNRRPRRDRIWSHKGNMQEEWTSQDNIKVYAYHVSPALWGTCGSDIGRIGVIAHETGHYLGLPDMYDNVDGGLGIGSYGLMANSWGFDNSQHYPPLMSAYSKIQLGWLTPTVLSEDGEYSLEKSWSSENVYKVTHGFPDGEYMLIENRHPGSFDTCMPQGGLAIWHIDEKAPLHTQGYPGESGWPANGNHYKVALMQADGNYDLEKSSNFGDAGDLFHGNDVDILEPGNGTTFPNTDTYQSGHIKKTNVTIFDVSVAGESMSFKYSTVFEEPLATPAPTPSPGSFVKLDSGMTTNNGGRGCWFDVEATLDIIIKEFDVHLGSTAGTVEAIEIYYKSGSYIGHQTDKDAWTQIAKFNVVSAGYHEETHLDEEYIDEVAMDEGDTGAFYITLLPGKGNIFRYVDGAITGDVHRKTFGLIMYQGSGGYYFSTNYNPRIMSGNIYYNLNISPTKPPTKSPTKPRINSPTKPPRKHRHTHKHLHTHKHQQKETEKEIER